MNRLTNYIGINNRVPYAVLEQALHEIIKNGEVSKEQLYNHIKEYTNGENRARKSVGNVNKIFKSNINLIKELRNHLGIKNIFDLTKDERYIILLCLFCLTFPIAYNLLCSMAGGFKVEAKLNKLYIHQKIGSIYGGNRSMHIAVDEIIPLFIELDLINREKIGIYLKSKKINCQNIFLAELLIYTDIKLSGSKSILLHDLSHRAWYSYFDIPNIEPDSFKDLIIFKDSTIGKGYLTLK